MQSNVSRRRLLTGGSLGVLASLAGCLATGRGETETVTETYETDGVGAVSLSTESGSITVEGGQGDAVEVRGHKAAPTEDTLESVTIETSRDGDRLVVEGRQGDEPPFLFGPDPKLDLEVTIPAGVRLARAATTNGDIDVREVTGELAAETTNGDIDVRGVDGGLVAESTNGSIRATGVSGDVHAETTNGSIDVTLADGDSDGDLFAESTNGDVTVLAPDSLDAIVSAATTNGDVSVEGIDGVNVSSDDSVDVTLGDGTRSVRVETTNGDVTVRSESDG
ncbi:DUF4097 family beta strand repeat-containing protein [Natrinema salaciae]|uniref:Putative adhesin n=1 Tax=Natrinema salaciae TaxID=1186196 RepID=A0A1H9GZJ5_9EURY|nr:DUF4097 family beta strand repeat-containing protein [Natrinema salaciae]SEQ55474.1 Putative adhesin [Natrinema salaciae]